MRKGARRWEIPKGNSQDLIGKSSVQTRDLGNTIGYCTKVYPELLMAEVESPAIGKRILPYTPESGIRKGSTVLITVASNIPRITDKIYFGYSPEKTVILDIDAGRAGAEKKFIYKNTTSPDWDKDKDGEHVAHHPAIVKHEPGEKVYNVDFAGLKIGFTKVSLFYHPQARIELFKHTVEMIAISTSMISKAGVKRFIFDEATREAGYSVEKNTDKKNGEYFDTLREYRGNVKKALSDDDVEIHGYTPDDAEKIVNDAVLLTIVLDYTHEKYERPVSSVSHEYKNRELKVIGGDSDDTRLHSKLKGKAKIGASFEKSRAIFAKVAGEDFPVVYLKAVSKTGDVYEFNAGSNIRVSMGDTYSLNAGEKSDSYFIGNKNDYIQEGVNLSHYPVSEKASSKYEYFGTNIVDYKGDVISSHHRKLIEKKIFTHTEYEVDKKANIETLQKIISPVIVETIQTRNTSFKKIDNSIGNEPSDRKVIIDNNRKTDIISDAGGSPFVVLHTNKAHSSELALRSKTISMTTPDQIILKSKLSLNESNSILMNGRFMLDGEMSVIGNLFITADNIVFNAKDYFVVAAESSIFQIEKSIGFTFAESLYMQNTGTSVGDDKDHIKSAFSISETSLTAQADSVNIYASKDLIAVANKRAMYGAERASIFGLDAQ